MSEPAEAFEQSRIDIEAIFDALQEWHEAALAENYAAGRAEGAAAERESCSERVGAAVAAAVTVRDSLIRAMWAEIPEDERAAWVHYFWRGSDPDAVLLAEILAGEGTA